MTKPFAVAVAERKLASLERECRAMRKAYAKLAVAMRRIDAILDTMEPSAGRAQIKRIIDEA